MAATCVPVNLTPACVDLSGIRAGDRNMIRFTLLANGTPVDLTDQTVSAQARKKKTDEAAITAEVTMVDAANGVVNVRWPGDQVRTLLNGSDKFNGMWDLQIDDPDGGDDDATTVVEGKFVAVLDVTRPGVG